MKDSHKMILFILFSILAVLALPFTALWAVFAGIAGYHYPMKALRGENFDQIFSEEQKPGGGDTDTSMNGN